MKKSGHVCWVAPGSDHCLAVQSSDTAPILIALDAQVRLVGPTQTRWLPLQALYQADGLQLLIGQRPDADLIEAVAQVAYQSAKPLDNTDMSLSYRKQMVRVYVARALRTVLQQQ